jgi:multiple sugar transport system substrate-binding protein
MATMKDVAELAGVSTFTVSCTLSGKMRVAEKSRVKVLEAIETLSYIPNKYASQLRTNARREIGVLLTSIDDPYHSEIFKGITQVIQDNNFSANIAFSNNQPRLETEILNDYISRSFSGLIIISCMPEDTAYFEKLVSHNIPLVFIERRPKKLDANFAGITNRKTITFLLEELIKNNFSDITLFCGSPVISSENDCVKAFNDFSRNKKREKFSGGIKFHIAYTNMSKEDAFRVALLEMHNQNSGGAIIATSVNIAYGIIEAAKVLGVSLADKIVITFSEESWMENTHTPFLIHTSRPAFKLGKTAASLLLQSIKMNTQSSKYKSETILLNDNILRDGIVLKPYIKQTAPKRGRKNPHLNFLMLDSPYARALRILSNKFNNDCGISINI